MEKLMNRVQDLLKAIKTTADEEFKEDDIKAVENYVMSFPEYFNSVIAYVVRGNLFGILYEGEEYRDRMTELDQRRRRYHINATDAANKLNRLAEFYHTKPIIEVGRVLNSDDIEDREFVVNYVFRFCTETFLDEVQKSGYNLAKDTRDYILNDMVKKEVYFKEDKKILEEFCR